MRIADGQQAAFSRAREQHRADPSWRAMVTWVDAMESRFGGLTREVITSLLMEACGTRGFSVHTVIGMRADAIRFWAHADVLAHWAAVAVPTSVPAMV